MFSCCLYWHLYLFCLFMRVLLSWFPSIDWNAQPWTFLRLVSKMAVAWRGRWSLCQQQQRHSVPNIVITITTTSQSMLLASRAADYRAVPADLQRHPATPVRTAGLHAALWLPNPARRGGGHGSHIHHGHARRRHVHTVDHFGRHVLL